MDFLKVKEIMELYWKIDECSNRTASDCRVCPLEPLCSGVAEFREYSDERLIAAVDFLKKWDANRPKKTRQSEFLKIVPNAKLNSDGVIVLCPEEVDGAFKCPLPGSGYNGVFLNRCNDCHKSYWLTEIEED